VSEFLARGDDSVGRLTQFMPPEQRLRAPEYEAARSVRQALATVKCQLPDIGEIGVVTLAVEQVNLIARPASLQHSVLGKVVVRPLPQQDVTDQLVLVLLRIRLLLPCHEEDDFVVLLRCERPHAERASGPAYPHIMANWGREIGLPPH